MAVITYNFVDITSPSSTHKCTYNDDYYNPPTGTEVSSENYTAMSTENGTSYSSPGDDGATVYARFAVGVSNITKLTPYAKATAGGYSGELCYFEIWNFYSSAWELIAESETVGLSVLTADKTPDATHVYVSGGYCYLIIDGSSNSYGSAVTIDYVKLDVTYTASAGSAIKTWNGLADAPVKTSNGLARASVKTKNGLA